MGITELFTSLIVSSLALGVLANPVALVAGNGGMIKQSRDFGFAIAVGLAHDGQTGIPAEAMRTDTTALLVDTFVRLPAQTLNFGTVLDGGKCQSAYDAAVKGGPYGDGSDIRDAVGGCDSALGDVAANPSSGQAISAVIIIPAAALVLVFAIVLAGAVMMAGLYALYQSLKAIVTLVTGLLPGPARGPLWHTVADLVMALVTLVFAIVFLTGYLLLIQAVFEAGKPGDPVMATFFFVDILLVAGVILFWRGRKSLRRGADRLAQVLATRPGGAAQLPARRPFDPAALYYRTRMAAGAARTVRRAGSAVGDRYASAALGLAGGVGTAARLAAAAAGYARRSGTPPSSGGPPGGSSAAGPSGGSGGGGGSSGAGGAGGPLGRGRAGGSTAGAVASSGNRGLPVSSGSSTAGAGASAPRLLAIVQGRRASRSAGRLSAAVPPPALAARTSSAAAVIAPATATRRLAVGASPTAVQRVLPAGRSGPRNQWDHQRAPTAQVLAARPDAVDRPLPPGAQRLRLALEARRRRPLALPPAPSRPSH